MGQPFRFILGHSRPAAKGANRFKLRRRTAVIFLERRDGTVLECLVSRKDFHRVRRHHWYANKNGKRASYAVAWIDGAQVQMHKHLCPNWAQVNHQNGNGLDERRENQEPPDRDRKQHPTPITSRSVSLGLVPTEVRAGFGFPATDLADLGSLSLPRPAGTGQARSCAHRSV